MAAVDDSAHTQNYPSRTDMAVFHFSNFFRSPSRVPIFRVENDCRSAENERVKRVKCEHLVSTVDTKSKILVINNSMMWIFKFGQKYELECKVMERIYKIYSR